MVKQILKKTDLEELRISYQYLLEIERNQDSEVLI